MATDFNPNWWYLNGEAYDFSGFVDKHPGGWHAIGLGKGRDCTGLFESNHTNISKATSYVLDKYKIKDDNKIKYLFSFKKDGFYRTVKHRAEHYFKSKGLRHTKGGSFELLHFVFLIICLCIFGKYAFINNNPFFAILFGIFKALIVVSSAHSASHYSFSINPYVNYIVVYISMCIIGMENPSQWTTKHVINHHILTNITPIDQDTIYPIKRCFVHLKRLWYHKYQHIYMWIFYIFLMIPWSITKSIHLWYGILLNNGIVFEGEVIVQYNLYEAIINNMIHHIIRWFLPFYFCSTLLNAFMIFLLIEISDSLWFSLQFAVNHEVKEAVINASELENNDQRKTKNPELDWGIHQLLTSHNYAVDSVSALHFSGGLNTQIEHHLFPSVHYKYYKDLSKIVKKTCNEFNLPYNESKTLWIAIKKHYNLLKTLGSKDKFD